MATKTDLFPHQTSNWSEKQPTVGATTSDQFTFPVTLNVPWTHRFRRLYVGASFMGDLGNSFWTAEVVFSRQNRTIGKLWFQWAQNGYKTNVPAIGFTEAGQLPIVPPYSVEVVPNTAAPMYVSAAPASPDEMILQYRYGEDYTLWNFRLMPIPMVVECDKVEGFFRFQAFESTVTPAAANPRFVGVMGMRSSEIQV